MGNPALGEDGPSYPYPSSSEKKWKCEHIRDREDLVVSFLNDLEEKNIPPSDIKVTSAKVGTGYHGCKFTIFYRE